MVPIRVYYLIERFIEHSLKDEEKEELAGWIDKADNDQLEAVLKHAWQIDENQLKMPGEMSKRLHASIFQKQIHLNPPGIISDIAPDGNRYVWIKMLAAAGILVLISTLIYLSFYQESKPGIVNTKPAYKLENDVLPGDNKAMLTLSDGSKIILDSASNGVLALDNNSVVEKLANGQLVYRASLRKSDERLYNTLTTPYGGQYKLNLPDGSKVWLNAASSIRFPTSFLDNERRVQVTGEVYFEIASLPGNKGQTKIPFIVQINYPGEKSGEVEVLGTHFNVNAYSDEALIKTTLLEGAVKIRNQNSTCLLVPGQQGHLSKKGEIKLIKNVDLEEAVAWKNGYFQFESAELSTILREAARWYNLEVVYEGTIPDDRFSGKIERSVKLSRLLKWMQWSDVKFKLLGRKIIVYK